MYEYMLHFIGITIIPTEILELLFLFDTLLLVSGSRLEPKIKVGAFILSKY